MRRNSIQLPAWRKKTIDPSNCTFCPYISIINYFFRSACRLFERLFVVGGFCNFHSFPELDPTSTLISETFFTIMIYDYNQITNSIRHLFYSDRDTHAALYLIFAKNRKQCNLYVNKEADRANIAVDQIFPDLIFYCS